MIARGLALAIVIGVVAVGCGSLDQRGGAALLGGVKDCQNIGVNCVVNVDTFCADNPAIPCVILVSDSVVTLRPSNGTKNVAWTIDSGSKFEFPSTNAITIDSGAFDCPTKTAQRWHCQYKKANPVNPEQYKYTVRLIPKTGTRAVDPLDPWVVTN